MAVTRRELVTSVLARLGDAAQEIWTRAEIERYVQEGYKRLALDQRVFWDWTYVENLPPAFTHTAAWEADYATFQIGVANYTMDDERRLLTETDRIGPAWYTSTFEATDGFLSDAGASTAIPATAELSRTLTEIDRGVWDNRALTALTPSLMAKLDSRYESTEGQVYGFLFRQDGIRTLRKIRKPSEITTTYTVNGSWGLPRSVSDLSSDTVSGTWGIPRRIAGQHPIGSERFGCPRRPYHNTLNVRLEHWRHGRALDRDSAVCELPDRYAWYLRDYAQSECLRRPSPAQDLQLAEHYAQRWQRGLARIAKRRQALASGRTRVMGGRPALQGGRPPRPVLPWAFPAMRR